MRLHGIHERCDSIDAKHWSEYRTALDAGLDELDSTWNGSWTRSATVSRTPVATPNLTDDVAAADG
ncbi:hypothetical protein GCM10010472_68800 [Pseudonocardia halophobica]|uniref:Uncharacterized protein n=1 Tax=Pseudonocardia halophobica TaxID=29401 RepID=A0A9W6NXE3_9PSEU|nr:hypothetical protein GCM10017577_36920 [Pseudonocardia halophobica]